MQRKVDNYNYLQILESMQLNWWEQKDIDIIQSVQISVRMLKGRNGDHELIQQTDEVKESFYSEKGL